MLLHTVSARQGLRWALHGVRTFWRQPLAMTGLFFLFMATLSLASMLPVVGGALALVLIPALTAGIMAASQVAAEGRFPMPMVLWQALRQGPRRKPLLQLGGLYAAAFLGLMLVSLLADGGQFARIYLTGEGLNASVVQSDDFQAALWLTLVLYVPLSMLFWHAPALVYWQGVGPLKSLFFSWMACWRNKAAFVVYVAVWMGFFALAGLVALLGATLTGEASLVNAMLLPMVLLVAAMFFTSMLFTVKDCFTVSEPQSA